jgi:predicted YcjX-like family ATPase
VKISNVMDAGRLAAGGLRDFASGFVNPTLRLGVTGLSRSGKTVFITALVHALTGGARLPLLSARTSGRISRIYLEPQPNDELPRFAYEEHLAALTANPPRWPESTRRISQLRLTIDYVPQGFFARNLHGGRLHLDIVDYPGEWLLDLPLMRMSYAEWSAATLAASEREPRRALAKGWHDFLAILDPAAGGQELNAVKAAELFTAYLAACRKDEISLSSLPPGRFLMPGDLAGSPLLTFAPLRLEPGRDYPRSSLADLMRRRYDAYVAHVVRPFFYNHFARLDRQIVLVDALQAINAGADAVNDLRAALTDVLACFRQGPNSLLSELFGHRIGHVMFAATKADLLHHASHDRLEAILRVIVDDAARRAELSGVRIDVAAIAAIRATREARVQRKGEELLCIAGTPQAGEVIDGHAFDGATEAAIFPGDLPADAAAAIHGSLQDRLKFVRFLPSQQRDGHFPHIRLDRVLEFLLGDRLE